MKRSILLLALVAPLGCTPPPSSLPPSCTPLTGEEIEAAFSDVVDQAVIEDRDGGSARNLWCRNGAFSSSFRTPTGSDELTGRWWVDGDRRCVSSEAAFPDDGTSVRCVPVVRCGDRLASLNRQGDIHGWHHLAPATCPVD